MQEKLGMHLYNPGKGGTKRQKKIVGKKPAREEWFGENMHPEQTHYGAKMPNAMGQGAKKRRDEKRTHRGGKVGGQTKTHMIVKEGQLGERPGKRGYEKRHAPNELPKNRG